MKTLQSILLFVALTWCVTDSRAGTADTLAREIIQSESVMAHNPADPTPDEAELQRVASANSRLRLNWLMLNDEGVTEEMRVCYAIRVLDDMLGSGGISRIDEEKTEAELALMRKRLLLGQRLLELDKTKKPNKSEMATPRKPSD